MRQHQYLQLLVPADLLCKRLHRALTFWRYFAWTPAFFVDSAKAFVTCMVSVEAGLRQQELRFKMVLRSAADQVHSCAAA